MTTVYECQNSACPLGVPGAPGGRFTGGATKEQITTLTGDPEPEKHGEGVCPNCGKPGKKVGDEEPNKGTDPHEELHARYGKPAEQAVLKLRDRANDPADEMTSEQAREEARALTTEAQAKLTAAVERAEAKEDD